MSDPWWRTTYADDVNYNQADFRKDDIPTNSLGALECISSRLIKFGEWTPFPFDN